MVQNIITDLCHHLEVGIDGNLDISNKRVIVGTPTITLTNNILTISCDTAGANIYYTLDGSTPTSSSTKYTSAVTLNNSCTIKAIAIKGNKSSIVVSQNYIAILTQWKIVGNSEVHGNEIWSCGEYNSTDGKWHILVQPQGGSIADIVLDAPLRRVHNVADTIEFPSNTEGKALVTRNIASILLNNINFRYNANLDRLCFDAPYGSNRSFADIALITNTGGNIMVASYQDGSWSLASDVNIDMCIGMSGNGDLRMRDLRYNNIETFKAHIADYEMLFLLATPTTELVDASLIQKAESYTCVISQGAKAVEWSSFIPNSD